MTSNIYENLLYDILPSWFPRERYELKKYDIAKSTEWNIILYPNTVFMYFEEKNIPPTWYTIEEVKSKWFTYETVVFDQPVKDKFLKLKIKSRWRIVKATGKVIREDLDILEKWTKNTKSLWFFLKSMYRQILA